MIQRRTPLPRSTKPLKRTPISRGTCQLKRTLISKKSAKQRTIDVSWATISRKRFEQMQGVCELFAAGLPCDPRASTSPGHHKKPRGRGGENTLENCAVCCVRGHDMIHTTHQNWAKQKVLTYLAHHDTTDYG